MGMRTDSLVISRREGIKTVFEYLSYRRYSLKKTRAEINEWWADFRGHDSTEKFLEDFQELVWPLNEGLSEVVVNNEKQA